MCKDKNCCKNCRSVCQRVCLFPKVCYYYCKEKFLKSIWGPKIDKTKLLLTYYYNGKWYNFIYKIKGGVKEDVDFSINGKDVNDEIKKYWGVNRDFHGQKLCPGDFGFEELDCLNDDGISYHFDKESEIDL